MNRKEQAGADEAVFQSRWVGQAPKVEVEGHEWKVTPSALREEEERIGKYRERGTEFYRSKRKVEHFILR